MQNCILTIRNGNTKNPGFPGFRFSLRKKTPEDLNLRKRGFWGLKISMFFDHYALLTQFVKRSKPDKLAVFWIIFHWVVAELNNVKIKFDVWRRHWGKRKKF